MTIPGLRPSLGLSDLEERLATKLWEGRRSPLAVEVAGVRRALFDRFEGTLAGEHGDPVERAVFDKDENEVSRHELKPMMHGAYTHGQMLSVWNTCHSTPRAQKLIEEVLDHPQSLNFCPSLEGLTLNEVAFIVRSFDGYGHVDMLKKRHGEPEAVVIIKRSNANELFDPLEWIQEIP